MLPPRTSTAPTIGFGLVLPAPLSARRNARRMYLLSRSSSIRLKKARPRVSPHRLGGALTAGGVSQDRCNSSLGERALGCGRWSSALTEPFLLYVRSLTRAPLGRSVKRGAWRSDPKAPDVEFRNNHCTIAFGGRVRSRAKSLLSAHEARLRATLSLHAWE